MTAQNVSLATSREPVLKPVRILDLRPTQITVGMREVEERRVRWRGQSSTKKRTQYLQKHLIPVILGRGKKHFILDHHHLVLALHREGLKQLYVTVVSDLSGLDKATFWFVLDQRSWIHPFDHKGRRCSHKSIPHSIEGLRDDPYRSLAGELRRIGGFAKDTTPYSEFLWADFLRRRIKENVVEEDFDRAMEIALKLAKSKEGEYLPGWCGPSSG